MNSSPHAIPLVSAVIPVYNGERYLGEAIESILAQDYSAIDLLIIDDGSTDGSAAVAHSFGDRLRYHYQPNGGLSAAQNAGVREARGEFIGYLDCDDLWSPEKISLQMNAFYTQPEADLVFGHVRQFLSPDLKPSERRSLPANLELMPGYSTGTMLARIDVFHRVGLFSTQFRVGEFLEWYARAKDAELHSVMLDDILLQRRIHADNMGVRERDKRSDYLHAFKASLDRRRRGKSGSDA